jgi:hypothetical protein
MTPQETAHAIATTPVEDLEEVASLTFDEIEATHSIQDVQQFYEVLKSCGVDVGGLCKKKHPV